MSETTTCVFGCGESLLEVARRYAGAGGTVHHYGLGYTVHRTEGVEADYFREFIISPDFARNASHGGEHASVQYVGTFRIHDTEVAS